MAGARLAALAALLLAACASVPPPEERPMYGAQDRASDPELRSADQKLVADAIKAFGDRRAASSAFVADGDTAFRAGDLAGAMRLYNQAWLVDKDNPTVYQGFAGVLYVRDEFCESSRMLDAAAARGPLPSRMVPTAALVYAGCGITLGKVSEADSGAAERYYARAEQILTQADADPNVPRKAALEAWARYYYGRANYPAAWAKVAEYRRSVGSDMDPAFIASLREKQPEP